MIYSPAFHGIHRYHQYISMIEEIQSLRGKEIIIDVDFIFPEEIEIYMRDIFWNVYKNNPREFIFQSKDRKQLRRIRKYLRRGVIPHEKIFKFNRKVRIKVIA